MRTTSDLEYAENINQVKTNLLIQELGELEVRLGQARLEGESEKVITLEMERGQILRELNPVVSLEVPYPAELAEAAYYGLAGEIIKAVEPHSEADPIALLMNLLTAYGNVIGQGSWFTVGADKHPCNLFCVFVGDTAKGRKGTSWSPIRSFFDEIEQEWVGNRVQTGLSSGEGLIYHVRDALYKRVFDKKEGSIKDVLEDGGVEDKRALIVEGEMAQTLKVLSREGNTLSPIIRLAWDSGNLQTLTKNSPLRATNAHVSIIGHITQQELMRTLGEVETGNGFCNRFLWFSVRRSKFLPFPEDFNSIDTESLISKLASAIAFGTTAGEIRWAEETKPLWAYIYPELSEGKPGLVGAITARAEAQVTRLACIYALLDGSFEIMPDHLRAALAIWGYAEASVKYIFQNTRANPLANKILNSLAQHPQGLTRTGINRLLGGNYKSASIKEALAGLKVAGRAYCEEIQTKGRPEERWFLTKACTEKTE